LAANAANPSAVHVGYTGQEQDDELGMINLNGRMYDPRLGRFPTPDPVVQAPAVGESFNRYAYVFNNPVNSIDPSGLTGKKPPCWNNCWLYMSGVNKHHQRSPLQSNPYSQPPSWSHAGPVTTTSSTGAVNPAGAATGAQTPNGSPITKPETGTDTTGTQTQGEQQKGAPPDEVRTVVSSDDEYVEIGFIGDLFLAPDGTLDCGTRCAEYSVDREGNYTEVGYWGDVFANDGINRGQLRSGIEAEYHTQVLDFIRRDDGEAAPTLAPWEVVNEGRNAVAGARMAVVGAKIGLRAVAKAVARRGGIWPVNQGKAGVNYVAKYLEDQGGKVLRREVTLEAGGVRTRPDLFVELPNGRQVFIEVKTGLEAGWTPNQSTAFPLIWQGGAIPRGWNAWRAGLSPGVPLGPTPVWTVHVPWPLPPIP
jgi:RHS repeat-associated protein